MAVAALNIDPLSYLRADELEYQTLTEVYQQAVAIHFDNKKNEIQSIGAAVGNALARAMRR